MKQSDEYNALKEENELLKGMLDVAIKEILQLDEDHGIVLVNHMVLCNTYEKVYECLKDRSLKNKS